MPSSSRVRGHASPQPPPLRTARECFHSSGSSTRLYRGVQQFLISIRRAFLIPLRPVVAKRFIIRTGFAAHFDMADDFHPCDIKDETLILLSVVILPFAKEPPSPTGRCRCEISVRNPPFPFVGVSPQTPSPEHLPELAVDVSKSSFAADVLVVVRPASQTWVEV